MRGPYLPQQRLRLKGRDDEDWLSRGSCRRLGAEEGQRIFFAAAGSDEEARAVLICTGCPVRGECLAFAVRGRIMDGTWGGRTESERRGRRGRRSQDSGL